MIIKTSYALMELLDDSENEILIKSNSYHIDSIWIEENHRGKKIGKILISLAKLLAKTNNKKYLTLYVASFDNGIKQLELIEWYKNQGFYVVSGYNMALDLSIN